MVSATGPRIVVGIDGTAGSVRALRWAAEEARQRNGTLRAVLTWEPVHLASYSSVTSHTDRGEQERKAEATIASSLQSVFGVGIPDYVSAQALEGVAERVLVRESYKADLLVLGSTPREQSCASVGPVIRGCLRKARCPVIVIGSADAARLQPVPVA